MRAMKTRIAVLILVLAVVVLGAGPVHARTVGQILDDAAIVTSIKAKIAADRFSNLWNIDVGSHEGVVTLTGTVDTPERRDRIGQLASWANGVKSVVNNIKVSGDAKANGDTKPGSGDAKPGGDAPLPIGRASTGATFDATGNVARVEPSTGTLALADGRVLRVTDGTTIWKSSSVEDLRPGAQVLIRNGTQAGVEGSASPPQGDWRMGTVRRVNSAAGELILADGTVVNVSPATVVQRGTQRLTLDALEPGWEVVVTAPKPPAVEVSQIDVVWAPTASAR
jgi:hypothetical protein